ncbi:hypothetical protein [Moritella yayanosii]|uniref:Permease n=1 Tax=Moritella yayanosii TaxID=69539 RepID=A0A330LWU7_9GAMM
MKHSNKIARKGVQLSIIGLIAALMGIGQNGLLVSLPFLVTHSVFSLPTWSIIMAIGSFLFLPAAPFWGRYSDKHGCTVAGMVPAIQHWAILLPPSNNATSRT